jgi:tetratricopeptide (TPR) repeat protein
VSTFLVVNDHGAYDNDTLRSILFSSGEEENKSNSEEEEEDPILKEQQEQKRRLNLCTTYQEKLQLYNDETSVTFYPHVSVAFREYVTYFGPNDFFVLQKTVKEDGNHGLSLKSVLAILKLSDWDPDVFYKYRDPILNQISSCGYKLKEDMRRGMERVWAQYYLLDFDKDIAFEIGRFYYGIHHYNKAIEYYSISHEIIGEHHVTYHNLGLCYYSMRSFEKAIEFFDKAIAVNENYEKAKQWKEKVQKELYGTIAREEGEEEDTASSSVVPTYRPVYNVNDSEEDDSSDDEDSNSNEASTTVKKQKSQYPSGYVSLSDSGEDSDED